MLTCCPDVLKAKRHDLVIVESSVNGEGSLLLVRIVHADLVIVRVGVHDTEEGMPCCGIYQLVDTWKGVTFL